MSATKLPPADVPLPNRSSVRIERDQFGYFFSRRFPHVFRAASLRAGNPPVRGSEDISRLAVHNDAIDFAYIAQLESDARSGAASAIEKVAAAHYAAAQFLLAKGEITRHRSVSPGADLRPRQVGLLLNLAVLLSAPEPIHRGPRSARTRPARRARFCRRRQAHGLGLLRRK